MKNLIALFLTICLVFSCGSSQTNTDNKSTTISVELDPTEFASSITEEELKTFLYEYASDDFAGRETGELGQKKAVEFLKAQYVEMGIPSPLGDDDYFQEVALEVGKIPDGSITVNEKEFQHINDFIAFSSNSTGEYSSSEIVYAGYGIDHEAYSDYTNLDVKGKVVLIKAGEPKAEDGTYIVSGTKEPSKWSTTRQEYRAKNEVAAKMGAKALFYHNDKLFPSMSRRYASIKKSNGRGRMSLKGTFDDMYFFLIGDELMKELMPEKLETGSSTISKDINITYKRESDEIESENVLAYIEGSEIPDEVVVISAHLDHEGVKNGKVYNGADDDGSGTVAILEIAEAFKLAADKGQKPKRSVLFLHVTAEEKGLLGSRYYTDVDPVFPLENTVANLNIDMIGRMDPKRESANRNYVYLIGSDKLSSELHELSEAVNRKYCNIEFDYTFNDDNDPNRFYYRSDHYNFAKNNVPVIFYFNGTHDDYHQPSDTPDKIDYDILSNRTKLIFHTAWEIANRENRIQVDKS